MSCGSMGAAAAGKGLLWGDENGEEAGFRYVGNEDICVEKGSLRIGNESFDVVIFRVRAGGFSDRTSKLRIQVNASIEQGTLLKNLVTKVAAQAVVRLTEASTKDCRSLERKPFTAFSYDLSGEPVAVERFLSGIDFLPQGPEDGVVEGLPEAPVAGPLSGDDEVDSNDFDEVNPPSRKDSGDFDDVSDGVNLANQASSPSNPEGNPEGAKDRNDMMRGGGSISQAAAAAARAGNEGWDAQEDVEWVHEFLPTQVDGD